MPSYETGIRDSRGTHALEVVSRKSLTRVSGCYDHSSGPLRVVKGRGAGDTERAILHGAFAVSRAPKLSRAAAINARLKLLLTCAKSSCDRGPAGMS